MTALCAIIETSRNNKACTLVSTHFLVLDPDIPVGDIDTLVRKLHESDGEDYEGMLIKKSLRFTHRYDKDEVEAHKTVTRVFDILTMTYREVK